MISFFSFSVFINKIRERNRQGKFLEREDEQGWDGDGGGGPYPLFTFETKEKNNAIVRGFHIGENCGFEFLLCLLDEREKNYLSLFGFS